MLRRIPSLLALVLAVPLVGFVMVQMAVRAKAQTKRSKGELSTAAACPEATGINRHIEGIKAQVLEYGRTFNLALKKRDGAAALGLMAGDWAYSNERGESLSKQKWVAARVSPNKGKNLIFPFMQHVDVEWHVFGDNVVVETGRSNSTLYYKGKVSHGPRRETAVYTRINGRWVQASLHVGFIPQEQRDFTFPASALPTGVSTPSPSSPPPKRRFLQMAGYQETTGIDPRIEEIRTTLLNLTGDRSQAIQKKDASALLGIMASNWTYSNERGETFGKARWVDNLMTGKYQTTLAKHSHVEWHVFGDNVVVETAHSDSTLHYKGKVSRGPRRETVVYTRIDGKWVQASLQVGLVPGEQVDSAFPTGALPK